MAIKIQWTAGLSEKEAKDMRDLVSRNTILLGRLREILTDKLASNEKTRISLAGYDSPNWAQKQADANGYQRALNEILELIG